MQSNTTPTSNWQAFKALFMLIALPILVIVALAIVVQTFTKHTPSGSNCYRTQGQKIIITRDNLGNEIGTSYDTVDGVNCDGVFQPDDPAMFNTP